jgi:hypothetical protein
VRDQQLLMLAGAMAVSVDEDSGGLLLHLSGRRTHWSKLLLAS